MFDISGSEDCEKIMLDGILRFWLVLIEIHIPR